MQLHWLDPERLLKLLMGQVAHVVGLAQVAQVVGHCTQVWTPVLMYPGRQMHFLEAESYTLKLLGEQVAH